MAITTLDTTRPAASTTNFVSGAATTVQTLFASVQDFIERRRTVAMLNDLTDAQLADMGMIRADIERVVTAS